ncbi:hypothetical protein [Virgibacillus pantothenticus]|uniref:hypothetical protein n=1 Tax=Virgibacillus pantothenticus TaxID=1473 RepID=UPI0009877B08|nr:hypothetical protein [Virgibacillus pantothenticus]
MKLLLICPSNRQYMPYLGNYELLLKNKGIEYEIILWDRFHIEHDKENEFIYRDLKVGHQRGYLDYCKYVKFIKKRLACSMYKKVIIFGIQLTFFLKKILKRKYYNEYILDIRDYNKVINFFNLKKTVLHSKYTVISSPCYKSWLPESTNYIVNHNTRINDLNSLQKVEISMDSLREQLNIGYIGSLRDYCINIKLINSLKNSKKIKLNFHGQGNINDNLIKYVKDNDIKNVEITGGYKKEEENDLYKNCDIINVLLPNDEINSKTLLPNRLYNAVINGKILMALGGTFVSEIVEKYNLGVVLKSFENVENQLTVALSEFDLSLYAKGRSRFFKKVLEDNKKFVHSLEFFLHSIE